MQSKSSKLNSSFSSAAAEITLSSLAEDALSLKQSFAKVFSLSGEALDIAWQQQVVLPNQFSDIHIEEL